MYEENDENIRVYDKRHNCYFCNKLVCKITRHLESVHNKELEVSKLLALNVKDLRRDVRGESIALLGNVFSKYSTDYVVHIVSSFRDDDIGSVCKEKELIMKFGLLLFEKYYRHQYEYIRQSMRQLGSLLLTIEEVNVSKLSLQKCILPINDDILITAVKRLCVSQRTEVHQLDYGIPSLAVKLGHNLRKCALIARGIALRKGDLQTDKQMEGFLDLMSIEWNARVSSAALRTLRHKKMSAPELLLLTGDLVTLNEYLKTVIKEGCGKFNNSFNPQLWARLASATLCRIILFNKRRSGEASRMTITQYAARPDWKEQSTSELTATLTPLEMNLANRLTIVEVPGKSRSLMKVFNVSVKN
ncbi:hypothetical protein RN001_012097 [Aquatica leii]|uniref:Uncharacterized protein n=1 Tax=Aquatica leii TaxID=1421715 RepID=A0AAN7Q1B4_9COLE|nr:hypothetical protein RN001_012097 [Aquatica leii]